MRQWIRPRAAYFTRILSSRGKPIRHADRRRTNGIFFFRISAPYLWAVSKTFRWDFTGEFISAVSLYLFLSPFFFFFFFTFSFGQVYQRQTDKFVCRGTMLLRMNNNPFLRITCFAKCTRIMENHFQNPRTIDHSLCKLSRDCTPLKMYKFASITASFRYFFFKTCYARIIIVIDSYPFHEHVRP